MTYDDIYFYWDAKFGLDPLARGAGDPVFTRDSPAWKEDRRDVWRRTLPGNPRLHWIQPEGTNEAPKVAAFLEPARTIYPRQNVGLSGWTPTATGIDDTAALASSGLLGLVPEGEAVLLDNSEGESDLTILAPNDKPGGGGSWTPTAWVRQSTDRFYQRLEVENDGTGRVRIRVPPGEVWLVVLPQLEDGEPTSPWPMPEVDSDRNRAGDAIEWAFYLPEGWDFYLHHRFAWGEGVYSLGVYFGDLGFCTVLRLPDGTTIEEPPEEDLPPFVIEQDEGNYIKLSCVSEAASYKPLSLALVDPRGFTGLETYTTLEEFLAEAESIRLGPNGLLLT